jgi:phytoene dehydrogenase-like protein
MTMGNAFDSVIIGGGHNGLVCACYLARAGQKVLVLEAANQVGGASVTRPFAPGFRVSACAHLLHMMPSGIMNDLDLTKNGLRLAASDMSSWALATGGDAVEIGGESATPDGAAYARFTKLLNSLADALRPVLNMVPPRLGTDSWADRADLLRVGWNVRKLGRKNMQELLRIIGMNAYDLLEDNFESDLVKGAIGFDAVLGTNFGPRSPGTVLTLLTRMVAQGGAGPAGLAQPTGGMGAVTQAIATAARGKGVEIRTGQAVAHILVENDRATGVILASGETICARAVISNADPKSTFLNLLGTMHLDTGFVRRVHHMRARGVTAKLHLALSALPAFSGIPPAALGGRLIIAPSLDYVERAYNHTKYGEASQAPALEITLPSINDPDSAPAGQHVLSAIVQYAPYALKAGWPTERDAFKDRLLAMLETYAPGLTKLVIATELLTPVDIESEFRMSGGHWHHGDLAFDQFFMVRPVPGAAQYSTPMQGLFLCGAGSHPGGGVMGIAGRNAAGQVLRWAA